MKASNLEDEENENNLKLQEEILRNLPRLEMQKKRNEIDDIKRKAYKIHANIARLEQNIPKVRASFDELKKAVNFLIQPTLFLGQDRFKNLYFFFSEDPTGIYCEEHHDKGAPARWVWFSTEQEVNDLLSFLNRNGKRENSLHINITKLTSQRFVQFEKAKGAKGGPSQEGQKGRNEVQERMEEEELNTKEILEGIMEYTSIYQPQEEYIKNKAKFNKQLNLLDYFRDKVYQANINQRASTVFLLTLLLDLEAEFSSYLYSRKCRWIGTRPLIRQERKGSPTQRCP